MFGPQRSNKQSKREREANWRKVDRRIGGKGYLDRQQDRIKIAMQ